MKSIHSRVFDTALLSVLLIVFACLGAYAQPEEPSFFIGMYVGAGVISHTGPVSPDLFSSLGEFPSTATFQSGNGFGLAGGALFDAPISDVFSLGLRIGYQGRGGTLSQQYLNTQDLNGFDGMPRDGRVQGDVEVTLGYLNVTPLVRIRPFDYPIYGLAEPTLLLPLVGRGNYEEHIVSPGVIYRENNSGQRQLGSGDFHNTATVLATTLGVGLEIPFSPLQGLLAELHYSPMLADITALLLPGEQWRASAISGVLAFRYGFGEEPDSVKEEPPPVLARRDTGSMYDTSGNITAKPTPGFRAAAVLPNSLSDTLVIQASKVQSTEIHALLPYIFFEQDSAVLPARYPQIDRRGIRAFDILRIPRGSTLGVYYELLNIVGQRLNENRKTTITLTGCVSQFEHNDTTLARKRAEVIRDYLVNVWRIREDRIKIVASNLPTNPSLSEVDTLEGARENQRVEISSKDNEILAPVTLPDTTYLSPAGIVRFFPPTVDSNRTNNWILDLQIGDSLVKSVAKGYGPPIKPIDVPIDNRPDLNLGVGIKAIGTLTLQDTLFETFATYTSSDVTVIQQGQFSEHRQIVNGNYLDQYNLLLFSFDSAGVFDFTRQSGAIMRDRITPNSKVRIIGHTDRIGLPPYNRALSLHRAEVAASLIGITGANVAGLGEKNLLYDNTFPEGRYYCRTVTVIVETPIKGESEEMRR